MPSEKLASGENLLKGELAAAWNILEGSSGDYTDLGIARRFGAAAAAYSLRDIGAMNGSVVRVRREPEDTTDAIDDEERFSANQVQSGALEDWVNGKLESTLPADVATAAAAYSLRKVRADYANDAVRIRRSSDDVEVNVALDSDDKVSASSAITNVAEQGGESGSTTATDLNGFLTEQSFFYKQEDNTSSSSYSLSRNSSRWDFSKVSSVSDGTTTKTGEILKLEATGTNGTFLLFTNPEVGCTNHETTITFDYLFPSSNSDTDIYVNVNDSASTSAGSPTVTPNDINGAVSGTWTTASHTFSSASSGQLSVRLTNSPTSTIGASVTPDAGDEFYITNLKISTVKADAFVHTWYDQAGSNDAIQATDANQPKIAENGALLADGLDFDGSNDEMVLTSALGATTVQSIFAVQKNDITSGGSLLFDNRDANDDGSALFATDSAGNKQASWDAADAEHTATTNEELIGLIKTSSAITIRANGAQSASTASSSTIDISTVPKIGQGSFGASGTNYDGSIKEIICYNSDQSDNSFKIESNINNYYGLYNDANELTEDFEGGSISSSSVSGQTFVANGKDGFTVTTSSSAVGEGGFTTIANALAYKISFNAKLNGNSVNIARRLNKHSSGAATQLVAITEGFNTYNYVSGSSTFTALTFTCSDNNATFTISDFKISRIARNGFVETWYDQSGNGIDMSQGTAGSQPTIVKNGGQVKSSNNLPAITFADNAVHLERAEFLTGQLGGYFIVGNALKADQDGTDAQVILRQGSSYRIAVELINAGNIRSFLRDGAGDDADARTSSTTVGDDEVFLNTTILTARGSTGLANYFNGGDESTANTTDVEDTNFSSVDSGNISIGSIPAGTFDYKGELMEVILFNTNVSSDRTTIETEINNHYNIY